MRDLEFSQLSNPELLTYLLLSGRNYADVLPKMQRLMREVSHLRILFDTPHPILSQISRLDWEAYATLQSSLEINRRYLNEILAENQIIDNSFTLRRYVISELRHQRRETLFCVFLNAQNRLIDSRKLFFGSINKIVIHPRTLVEHALNYNAASLVIAHNHPSGHAKPSEYDEKMTRHLHRLLGELDIVLIDHLIVGNGRVYSFAEDGKLCY